MLLAIDSNLSTALHFAPNIDLGRRIVPDQNHRESGTHPRSGQRLDFRRDFSPNFASDFIAVQNNRSHQTSLLFVGGPST